ncbi:MAG: hypothetical protein AB7D96_05585 [Arcobacteraceae bacterium]
MNSPIEKKITYGLFIFGTSMIVPKIYSSLSVKLKTESFSIEATNNSGLDAITYIGLFLIIISIILLVIFNSQLNNTSYTEIIKNWISNLFTKKLTITLNEKNRIIDKKQYSDIIDLMINYQLDNKNYELTVKSKKYQIQLQEAQKAKNLEAYNILKSYTISNNKWLNEYKNTLNEFIIEQVKNNYIPPRNIKDVAIGLVETCFHESNTTGLTKIDLATKNQDFSCIIFLTEEERKMLDEHIEIPISIMYINYGYDIWDLPFNLVYKKAIPSIIYELYRREKSLKNLQKYRYLKIGIG